MNVYTTYAFKVISEQFLKRGLLFANGMDV